MSTFCPTCGSSLPDDAVFCGSCGERFLQKNPSPPPSDLATPYGSPPPRVALGPPPRIAFPDHSVGAAPPAARRLSRLIVGLLIMLVLIPVILSLVVRNAPGGSSSSTPSVAGSWSELLFFCQMLLLTVVVCLAPTVVSWILRRGRYVVRVIVESLAFIVIFLGFGLWLFGGSALGIWIIYASALTVVIEAGSHFVEWRKDTTLKRLKDGISYKSIEADAEAIKKMTRYEVTLYVPVPIGLIIGTVIGLIRHQTTLQIVEFCVQLVLFLAALVLLYFLVVGSLRMSDPLFRTIPRSSPELTKPGRKGKKTAMAQPRSQEVQDQQVTNAVHQL